MRIASVGHAALAAVVIALGVLGLIQGELMPIWQPIPKDLPAHDVLVYACASVSLASGVALLWRRLAATGSRVLLAQLAIWVVAFRVPDIVRAPGTFGAWDGCAETIVILAAACILHAWFATTGDTGVRIARVLYGVALIPFGLAHFIYLHDTAALVPGWLPAPTAWACVTGGAFLIAGAAVIAGVLGRLAAMLSALQIGLFTALVWIPIVAAGATSRFVWNELGISAALTAAAWVVAESYSTINAGSCSRPAGRSPTRSTGTSPS